MKVLINRNKKIGKVIYVVEGDKTEPELIGNIYKHLGYNYVKYDKINNSFSELVNSSDKYSRVYIVPAKYSSLSSLRKTNEYFDSIYHKLAIDYGLDVENAAIFYIFDRDRESNRPNVILKSFDNYCNSRDNSDFNMNGLMLLSYPSIEAFYCNINDDKCRLSSGKAAKEYVEDYLTKPVNDNNLILGTKNVINKVLNVMMSGSFKYEWLDSFEEVNKLIFKYEEDTYCEYKNYDTLTLLFISLIDIGVFEIENE